MMIASFNIEELDEIAFELGVGEDILQKATLKQYALSLIQYAIRTDTLYQLRKICAHKRPNTKWPHIY